MRTAKLICVVLVALFASGCACHTKKRAMDEVPVPTAGDILKDVHFAFDSFALNTDDQKTILKNNADWLKKNQSAKVQLEGHCDERGTNEYNMALGAHRAKAVFDFLRGLGVDTTRMSTVSYGEELPLDPRHNQEAWAKNRRVHFNLGAPAK